jgi:membrane-bound ClpP family serine protease
MNASTNEATIGIALSGVAVVLAMGAYEMVFKAMRLPVTAGVEALMKAVGTEHSVDRRRARVWVASERWSATSAHEDLAVGDTIEVIGRDGLPLQGRRLASASQLVLQRS